MEIAASELRIGSVVDPSPTVFPLPSPAVHISTSKHSSGAGGGVRAELGDGVRGRERDLRGERERLGEAHWAAFVRYAESEHKAAFFRALTPSSGLLCCEGKIDGTPCPKAVGIDLKRVSATECEEGLPKLHMDHTHDVKHICEVWSKALPEHPASWEDGICGPLVAHLLFGTEDHVLTQNSTRSIWRKQIVLRCGNMRGIEGQHAADFCHDVASAHYEHTLRVDDIKWPTSASMD